MTYPPQHPQPGPPQGWPPSAPPPYGGAPYPPGPPAPPPPPPRRNTGAVVALTVAGALVGLVALGSCASLLSREPVPSHKTPATAPTAPSTETPTHDPVEEPADETKEARIGQVVRDGELEFTVRSVKKGVRQLGDSAWGEKADGQFVLVKVQVRNVDTDSGMIDDGEQTLVDKDGRTFDADTAAGMLVEGNDAFLRRINPGNTATVTFVFDMPEDAQPDHLELHGGFGTSGVSVRL